jgi:hypothetical protein
MKKLVYIIISFSLMFQIVGCKKDTKKEEVVPEAAVAYDLLIYDSYKSGSYDNKLQATLKKSDFQFSTFSDDSYSSELGNFNKAYVYNSVENTEAFMLFDDLGEPAFLYKIDMASGEKKEAVVEFEKQDANSFFVRFFYYDWQNRLGTLLFETVISKNGDQFTSTPSFVIDDLDFGKKSAKLGEKKGNMSFAHPIGRLEHMMSAQKSAVQLKNVQVGIDGWIESFNEMKNSTISQWLSKTQKTGAVLALTGLGLSETVIGAPVGVWLMAGGSSMLVASAAIEAVTTDKWSNFLTETKTKIDAITETATRVGDNMVSKYQGFDFDLKDHWVNTNTSKTSLEELTTEINEAEMLVTKTDLNDLPGKDGVLQIGLSWDTEGTDVDLWVTDPTGEKVYYGNSTSASGGYLDRDDTDGIGPENIYWVDHIPDGNYIIQVHYFSGGALTNYTVKATNGLGFSRTYTGTLVDGDQLDDVVTLHKSGVNISK